MMTIINTITTHKKTINKFQLQLQLLLQPHLNITLYRYQQQQYPKIANKRTQPEQIKNRMIAHPNCLYSHALMHVSQIIHRYWIIFYTCLPLLFLSFFLIKLCQIIWKGYIYYIQYLLYTIYNIQYMFDTQSIEQAFNFNIEILDKDQNTFQTDPEDLFPDDLIVRQKGILCYSSRGSHKQNYDKFDYLVKDSFTLAAVYDGHGDSTVSLYLKQNLLKNIANHAKLAQNPSQAILQCIKQIEQETVDKFDSTSGSTLMVVLWTQQYVIVANVGDGLCYGFKNDRDGVQVSIDDKQQDHKQQLQNSKYLLNQIHNLQNEKQRKSIMNNGGAIFKLRNSYRVAGQLNLSRSIGDSKYKNWITANPSIKKYNTQFSQILLCSDGFSKLVQPIQKPTEMLDLIQNPPFLRDNSTFILLDNPFSTV